MTQNEYIKLIATIAAPIYVADQCRHDLDDDKSKEIAAQSAVREALLIVNLSHKAARELWREDP